jgi:hypothetical protein
VLLNSAKEAPAAFLPHLQPLVARVQQLWDQVGGSPAQSGRPWSRFAFRLFALPLSRRKGAEAPLDPAETPPINCGLLQHAHPTNQPRHQGLLREGEKVSLYEGLMAAATSGGPELQTQLLEW